MLLKPLDQIPFDELYALLLTASRKAFRFVQATCPDETFYAFGLCYYMPPKHIFPVCNSEEAHIRFGQLSQTDRESQSLNWFYERWEVRQWHYYGLGKKYFYPVAKWIDFNLRGIVAPRDQLLVWANIDHKIEMTCLKVLKTLDEEHVFGEGAARENIVLTLSLRSDHWMMKFDEYEYMRLLNSASTYERWRIENELCDHAQRFLNR